MLMRERERERDRSTGKLCKGGHRYVWINTDKTRIPIKRIIRCHSWFTTNTTTDWFITQQMHTESCSSILLLKSHVTEFILLIQKCYYYWWCCMGIITSGPRCIISMSFPPRVYVCLGRKPASVSSREQEAYSGINQVHLKITLGTRSFKSCCNMSRVCVLYFFLLLPNCSGHKNEEQVSHDHAQPLQLLLYQILLQSSSTHQLSSTLYIPFNSHYKSCPTHMSRQAHLKWCSWNSLPIKKTREELYTNDE